MENRRAYVVVFIYLFAIFFLLKCDLLWNHFVTQNVMTNIVLPTHPPKTSDWLFAWQNGYGRHPWESNFMVWNWNIKFLFFFFSISSVFIIFHLHFWLSVIIRATLRQRTDIDKSSNINKIIIIKSWWNQEMAPYTKFRKIIEFGVM